MSVFTFDEMPDSRASTVQPASATLKFKACGEPSDSTVGLYALGATPALLFTSIGILYRQDLKLDPAGYAQYVVTVPYGPDKHETGSYTFSFDATGATTKIKCAKEHVESYYATSGPSDPHKGMIGVTPDGKAEGCDVFTPSLKLTVTFRHPAGVVNLDYVRDITSAIGCVNDDEFLGFDANELLFVGASGSSGSDCEAEIAYQFIASENAEDLTVGEITGIAKNGHDYAWVEYQDAVDTGEASLCPKAVHVESVYDAVDFADTFGWS